MPWAIAGDDVGSTRDFDYTDSDQNPFAFSEPERQRIECSQKLRNRAFPLANKELEAEPMAAMWKSRCNLRPDKRPWERLAVVVYDDGSAQGLCAPKGWCLDVDAEDALDSQGLFPVTWYPPRPAPLVPDWPEGHPPAVAGVCLDGPVDRAAPRLLQRLGSALRDGLGVEYRVVAAAASASNPGCRRGRRLYEHIFGSLLAGFFCKVDEPLEQLRKDFLAEAHNASWWEENEERFLVNRAGDPDLTLWTMVRNLQMRSMCLDALQDAERGRGSKFQWLVYLRNDYDFFAAHPPLAPMERMGGIWIPDGEDFVGLNDRWAVLQRRHASVYFRRYEGMVDGSAIAETEVLAPTHHLDVELLHVLRLHHHHLWPKRVHRFLTTATRRCVVRSRGCTIQLFTGTTHRHEEAGWRSIGEWSEAYAVARRLSLDGWSWRLSGPRRFYPTCMIQDVWHLCGPKPDAGTEFDGVFHTHGRCCPDAAGVLLPAPPDEGATEPSCWSLMRMADRPWTACVPFGLDVNGVSGDEALEV